MDLKALQETLRKFATERNWEQFHTPKNLSMALMVEAAELLELFQWTTPEESIAASTDDTLRVRIGEEMADVLLYLVQLADQTGVDLESAIADKLVKNAQKYAAHDVEVEVDASPEAAKQAQTHVLIDWENVQPKDEDIRALVPDVTNVWIFHGPHQKRVGEGHESFGEALALIPISRPGKNALDFHLSYYVGYISSRNPEARFVVISNDQGYGPMLEHAKVLGFAAGQVGFGSTPKAAEKPTAVKTSAKTAPQTTPAPGKKSAQPTQQATSAKPRSTVGKKTAKKKPQSAKKTTAKTTSKTQVAGKSATASKKPNAKNAAVVTKTSSAPKAAHQKSLVMAERQAYDHVLSSLRKSKNKPTRKARLAGAVKSLMGVENGDNASVERVIGKLIAEGLVEIDASGTVTKTP